MKKVMFVLVILAFATACFALESGPSNKVGYVKFDATGISGQAPYTPFGLPFIFWQVPALNIPTFGTESRRPSSILGSQPTPGANTNVADRIIRQDGGASAFRRTTGTNVIWTGSLETNPGPNLIGEMEPGRTYWYRNPTGTTHAVVLAGQVDTSAGAEFASNPAVFPIPTVTVTGGAYTAYSWRDSRAVNRDDLNLLAAGFHPGPNANNADRVIAQVGGASFFRRNTDNTWQGSLTTVQPGSAYWIQNRFAAFNYSYDASGASLTQNPNTPVIQKITPPTLTKDVSPAKTKARTE